MWLRRHLRLHAGSSAPLLLSVERQQALGLVVDFANFTVYSRLLDMTFKAVQGRKNCSRPGADGGKEMKEKNRHHGAQMPHRLHETDRDLPSASLQVLWTNQECKAIPERRARLGWDLFRLDDRRCVESVIDDERFLLALGYPCALWQRMAELATTAGQHWRSLPFWIEGQGETFLY